ncbi:DNA-binding CsgD family transcriptional regulator [Streptomyces sp. V4I8]
MTEAHPHEDVELCEPGLKLYRQPLMDGRLRAEDAAPAPCLVDLGLLQSSIEDLHWLEPGAPTVVLHRLLRASGDRTGRNGDVNNCRPTRSSHSCGSTDGARRPRTARRSRCSAAPSGSTGPSPRPWSERPGMYPQAVQQPTLNGVTPRRRAIAGLLIEGHTDASMADRLGMNVRTVRVHIAKLAATPGSESRAQLGYLIGQSGILDRPHRES